MSNAPNAPVLPTIPGPLPFTHSKRDVVEHLRMALGRLGRFAEMHATKKRPEYAPDWRTRHGRMELDEPKDTPKDRADFQRTIIGCALADGLDLKTSGEPGMEELGPAVAAWGIGALRHIQGLEQAHQRAISEWAASDLRQQQEYETLLKALEETRRQLAESHALRAGADAVIERYERENAQLRESLDVAEADKITMTDRWAHEVVEHRVRLEHAQALTRSAESARDAWQASATSSQDALALLKAALRIPTGPAGSDSVAVRDLSAPVRR